MIRFLIDQHPILFFTGVFIWFVVGSSRTIWGDAARKNYEWRMNSIFSGFLMPPPFDGEDWYVSSQKVAAWVVLIGAVLGYACFLIRTFDLHLPFLG